MQGPLSYDAAPVQYERERATQAACLQVYGQLQVYDQQAEESRILAAVRCHSQIGQGVVPLTKVYLQQQSGTFSPVTTTRDLADIPNGSAATVRWLSMFSPGLG